MDPHGCMFLQAKWELAEEVFNELEEEAASAHMLSKSGRPALIDQAHGNVQPHVAPGHLPVEATPVAVQKEATSLVQAGSPQRDTSIWGNVSWANTSLEMLPSTDNMFGQDKVNEQRHVAPSLPSRGAKVPVAQQTELELHESYLAESVLAWSGAGDSQSPSPSTSTTSMSSYYEACLSSLVSPSL